MSELPESLFCLIVQHNIDDAKTIEHLLALDPRTEQCMPIALRDVLNQYAELANLPSMPIPNAKTLHDYLTLMWKDSFRLNKLAVATGNGYVHLIPFLILHDKDLSVNDYMIWHGRDALNNAVSNGQVESLSLLLFPPHNKNGKPIWPAQTPNYVDIVTLLYVIKNAEIVDMLIRAGLNKHKIKLTISFSNMASSSPDELALLQKYYQLARDVAY